MNQQSSSPSGQVKPLKEKDTFDFACHSGVPCFTTCCRNADMYLYPYDIIRLKSSLKIPTDEILDRYTVAAFRDNPHFPHVMLKMSGKPDKSCPFLEDEGCAIYVDRPFSCRAYPLERAVSRYGEGENRDVLYFVTQHPYCKGHCENPQWTPATWMADQEMEAFNVMNDLWVDIDSIFRNNPWKEDSGLDSKALKMAFMACYDVDRFRRFVFESSFLSRFDISADRIHKIKTDDRELLIFGFDWVKLFLTNSGPLAK